MATTLLQVRIDAQTKKEADALFSELGLDTSTAIRVFIKQALKKRAIPFSIKAKSEERTEEEAFYSPENVAQLKQGYKELKAGRGIERELINA
ncbi:type II toxin-antitoxin system RelB/DinJ family antitoxin [Helicobacter sp. MIT 01-3238]|uniref:type II toxin-antitoxin system RelB/DinJ family antitoxin n=1 Tax=Helicobacter sp. MIT 01-3238 TaxID=398627 RepID=UPI000E1E946D|nr:type II toxin-antitoxin system RelB/DinJ family antitoxin [Helicobacter sp. MIT 01-3238]RDU53773.1 type II toxin-antitoxin system antitoxin, RelB/DinJ family [Helicobacter sp. MIT 01-3238]